VRMNEQGMKTLFKNAYNMLIRKEMLYM